MVWNPESRILESGIQKVGIQNPDAGIRNLEAGIRNPGPSWILLHGAKDLKETNYFVIKLQRKVDVDMLNECVGWRFER